VEQPPAQPLQLHTKLRVLKLQARREEFRIPQLLGNLFVCSPANGNCCCGRPEKGRMPFENRLYEQEWERRSLRPRVHLTFSGCFGPCIVGNNAMLQVLGRSLWFKDLNEPDLIPAIFDYIEAIVRTGEIVSPPAILEAHLYERYMPAGRDASSGPGAGTSEALDDGVLERLDPVCWMAVDPATAKHWLDYAGRRIYFCASSCKRLFLKDPPAYLPT
jgi:YHS domain-containing protein